MKSRAPEVGRVGYSALGAAGPCRLLCLALALLGCGAPALAPAERAAQIARPPAAAVADLAGRSLVPRDAEGEHDPPPGSGVFVSVWSAAARRRELHLINTDTGQRAAGFRPLVLGAGEHAAFPGASAVAPDGALLAVSAPSDRSCEPFAGGVSCRGGSGTLHLVDPHAGSRASVPLPATGWLGLIAFDPTGARVALSFNGERATTLLLVDSGVSGDAGRPDGTDAGRGRVVARRVLEPGLRPSLVEFAGDGAALLVYATPIGADPGVSRPGPPRVLLLDAASLETLWEEALVGVVSGHWCLESCAESHERRLSASWAPAVALSPDRRTLHIVHADVERLTSVDLEARRVRTAQVRAARSLLERLLDLTAGTVHAKGGIEGASKVAVPAAGGTKLYVVGRTQRAHRGDGGSWRMDEAAGVQVVDALTGRLLASREREGWGVRPALDGTQLLVDGRTGQQRWVELVDAASLEPVARLQGWSVSPARRLDGQPVLVASRPAPDSRGSTELAVLDAASLAVVRSWSVDGLATWIGAS